MRAQPLSALIASSAAVPLGAAIDASAIRATHAPQQAGRPSERIAQVLEELAILREDMGESDGAKEGSPWH